MSWLAAAEALRAVLAEANATLKQLGHSTSGFAPTGEPGVLSAACMRCWETGTIRLRIFGRAVLAGAALTLRCRPTIGR